MNPFRKRIAGLTLAAVTAGAGVLGYNVVQNVQFARAEQQVHATREQLNSVQDLANVFHQVGKVIEPSVVNIQVRKKVPAMHSRIPGMDDRQLRKFFRVPPDADPDNNDNSDTPDKGMDDLEAIGTGSGV